VTGVFADRAWRASIAAMVLGCLVFAFMVIKPFRGEGDVAFGWRMPYNEMFAVTLLGLLGDLVIIGAVTEVPAAREAPSE
jgi:hypothetical protein